ncbi:carboxypeptidase regulatory-like domain-containing protein [bacterium]|nr:carboxypeptidase regulatory-like domain-containing protein [bacterium]
MKRLFIFVILMLLSVSYVSGASSNVDLISFVLEGDPKKVAYSDTYLYTAAYGFIGIYDISIPTDPALVNYYDTTQRVNDVYVDGNRLYYTDLYDGLVVLDITDRLNPSYVGEYYASSSQRVWASGNYAYVGFAANGVKVFDVTASDTPTLTDEYTAKEGYGVSLSLASNTLYVAGGPDGMYCLDISDPYAITHSGSVPVPGSAVSITHDPASIEPVLVCSGSQLSKIVSVPSFPMVEDFFTTSSSKDVVYNSSSEAFVADYTGGIRTYSQTWDDSMAMFLMQEEDQFYANGYSWGVAVNGNDLYVAAGRGGLSVLDVTNISNVSEKAVLDVPGNVYGIWRQGNYLYVANDSMGITSVDITDPYNPEVLESKATGWYARDVIVSGNYLYIADYISGVRVWNISNPSSMTALAVCDTPDEATKIFLYGTDIYDADMAGGLRIIDVSTPDSPTERSSYTVPSYVYDVYVVNDYAYVASGADGLKVLNVSNPDSPTEVGDYNTTGVSNGVAVYGNHAFVADGNSGVAIIDITTPSAPSLETYHNTLGEAVDVWYQNGYLYVAANTAGLRILDVSDPTSPSEVGYYETTGSAYCIYADSEYIFVGDKLGGYFILDCTLSDPVATISGSIADSMVVALEGVSVSLSGDSTGNTITDASGYYEFANLLQGGTFTITPDPLYYGFAPSSRTLPDLSGDMTNQDFTGTLHLYQVEGNVELDGSPFSGIAVNLTGDSTGSRITDGAGYFIFENLSAGGTYTFTPSHLQYSFSPTEVEISDLITNHLIFPPFDATLLTMNIAGTVWDGYSMSTPLEGVTADLSGDSTGTTVTNASGNFSFTGLPVHATYTVTLSKTHYTFDPVSRTFSDTSANQDDDYVAVINTWYLDGTITEDSSPLSGVTVTVSDGTTDTPTTTNASGYYIVSDLPAGSPYTITPSLTNYSFVPASRTVPDLSNNSEANDFTAAYDKWTISGIVEDGVGDPISSASVDLSGFSTGSLLTSATGYYRFDDLPGGETYSVTISLTHYTFTPASHNYTELSSSVSNADFTGQVDKWDIQGKVTDELSDSVISDLIVTVTGGAEMNVSTNILGVFTFTGLDAGETYTVSVAAPGYSYTPAFRTYTDLSAGIIDCDFTAFKTYDQCIVIPNPTTGTIRVTDLAADDGLSLYDAGGSELMSWESAENGPMLLNIAEDESGNKLLSGVYFLVVRPVDGSEAIVLTVYFRRGEE